MDSPSKQLILDLIRDLEDVSIHNDNLKKVRAYERRSFYDNLDRIDREREAVHTAALDEAAALHAQVREEAEAILQEHIRAEQEERKRQEEAALKEKERVERIQREKAEQLRRQQEAAARAEAERKAKEEATKKAAEDAERARKAAQEEKERKEREDRERAEAEKRKQAEDVKKAQQEAEAKAKALELRKVGVSGLTADEARIQARYVEIHKTLKQLRAWLQGLVKNDPTAKKAMGDMRRSITKCVGQLRDGKGVNKAQVCSLHSLFVCYVIYNTEYSLIVLIIDSGNSRRVGEGLPDAGPID
jgi:nucleoporin GLE1